MAPMKAIVKSVLSGDTLILRGRPGPQGQPPKERILHVAEVTSPRMGSSTREDEPWAFECREFLRALAVGKEVTFTPTHPLPSNDDVPRDFGQAEINGLDLATELLKNGWAKPSEKSKREPNEEDLKRKDLENEARNGMKGMWNPQGPKPYTINHTMPLDSQAFMTEWKNQTIDAVVEQVRDGTTLRVRLFLPENVHQMANVALAGVRSAKAASRQGEVAEPWGEEAKFFTESRLLQRAVRVQLLSLPAPTAQPFAASAEGAPPASASMFIGTVLHPAGNIAEHLVSTCLARVVGWHTGLLANSGGMERLRAAEKQAKEKRLYLYANVTESTNGKGNSSSVTVANGNTRTFDATVIRIWSGDQVSVLEKDSGKERRLQLSSTRCPRSSPADPKQSYWASEAREFLRKKLIGKPVRVHVDFVRPREGEYEERECATVRFGNQNVNVAELVIEKGYASVVRHRRDDEDRSSDYDKLMAAEQIAITDTRGIHSNKEQTLPRIGNASETYAKANQFLSGFKRLGRVPAVVQAVTAGSRFKVLLPKENQTLTLVLAGIRAPRAGRGERERVEVKPEPYGQESTEFASRRYMQRDVEIEFESTDKSGGFIGAMYLNKTENAAITLVKEGLAAVHTYSAESLSWANLLLEAEKEAKAAKKNLWSDYDEATEEADQIPQNGAVEALKPEYMDVIVSDVRTSPTFGFSVQILNTEGIASLEKLMHDFSLHHRTANAIPGFIPRSGDLVSARFSDGSWYRAKIRKSSPGKKEAEVTFIDYGNQDTIGFKDIRPLDPKFRSLPGQAHDARLSFIKLVTADSEYHAEAIERFRSLCEGRKLIANTDFREGSLLHLRLMDPSDPTATEDPLACINADLIREGYASLDRQNCKYLTSYPQMLQKLQDAVAGAKRDRLGMFEFGDVEEDDD
ncbi:transcription factor [Hysterangium stoloniferum]|nr:transcription factor [Hysterangium stoloniferum]